MANRKSSDGSGCFLLTSCGCWLGVLAINVIFGAMSVNYCLWSFLDKSVDTWVAVVAGLFLGEVTIPLAIVCWLLRLCGVHVPFIH